MIIETGDGKGGGNLAAQLLDKMCEWVWDFVGVKMGVDAELQNAK